MSLRREKIDVAFADRLEAALTPLGLRTFDRRYLNWGDVSEQPAVLYVGETEKDIRPRPDVPPIWSLKRLVVVYLRCDSDPKVPAGTILNPWIDAIEKVCEFDSTKGDLPVASGGPSYFTTLGGLVAQAWISGEVRRYEALQGEGQLVATVPIEVVVPSTRS